MSEGRSRPVPREIAARVEELAGEIVMGGRWSDERVAQVRQTLEKVTEEAQACGRENLAKRARELLALVAEMGEGADSKEGDVEVRIQAGVVNLQRTLASEQGAQPPAPPSPPDAEKTEASAEERADAGGEANANPLAADPESMAEFVLEAGEHFQALDEELLRIERRPDDEELIHGLFRRFHTLKGLAGFLDLAEVRETAHAAENLLDRARSGELTITPAAVDLLLETNDALRSDVTAVEQAAQSQSGAIPELPDRGELRRRLAAFEEGQPAAPPRPTSSDEAAKSPPAKSTGGAEASRIEALRVDTGRLDALVDLTGELAIAASLVLHDPTLKRLADAELTAKLSQLSRLTQRIQQASMELRMVPVTRLFDRAARLARDLSRKSGKPVRVERKGQTTEVDKSVVELLSDPLLHVVRNALDHGVETPEKRRADGKSEEALLEFRARHRSGRIVIEVADDGAGVDAEKVLARARERGLVDPDQELSRAETLELIFVAGFSTAARVTELSGRGVGLDVVKRNLNDLRGRVTVKSEPGKGTVFRLTIPITLAAIDGLVVSVGDERYVAPIFAVREMIQPSKGMIERVGARDALARVRGRLLPIVRLSDVFRVPSEARDLSEQLLIVTASRDRALCLAVDRLVGKQEIVIKSLSEPLDAAPGISGGAILGDGRAALILDMDTLVAEALVG